MTAGPGESLRLRLLERGIAWPAPIHAFDILDSTNQWLRNAASAGACAWTVALAGQQSAGRGRHGRTWLSPLGGLYVSVVLELPARLDPGRPGPLTMMAGVAVTRALRDCGTAASLKWPNDVRVRGRKIAGLLGETVAGAKRPSIVLGIGVNVDLAEEDLPEALGGQVSSLRMERVQGVDVVCVGAAVLAEVRLWYDALAQRGVGVIMGEWRSLSEPWWGRVVEVSTPTGHWCGTAVGIAEDGALLIDRGRSGREALHAGDVELSVRTCEAGPDGRE